MSRALAAAALGAAVAPVAAQSAASDPDTLRMIAIDVEGGAATLYVTPQHHALLVDTGWPAGMGTQRSAGGTPGQPSLSSAARIVAAARAAGLDRIDYVLITHYHIDHVGGAAELLGAFPVGTLLDHGPGREEELTNEPGTPIAERTAAAYRRYVQAIGRHRHRTLRAGDTLRIDDLAITVVTSDEQVLARPLGGASRPNPACASMVRSAAAIDEENARSVGIVARWGRLRLLALGDLTWNAENNLVCPVDLIGPVDLMVADNHGTAGSNSSTLLASARPAVIVVNNGTTKGADAEGLRQFAAAPSIKAVWQLHVATRSPADSAPPERVANLDPPDEVLPLAIALTKAGAITIRNPRTGVATRYTGGR